MSSPHASSSVFALGLLVIAALTACDKGEKPKPTFAQARFSEVTPLLDGSAYAISSDSVLWYLRSNKAVRVTALAGASQALPKFFEITPVLDGSAYASVLGEESGLWYLHAEHAEKVTEVSSLAGAAAPLNISDKAFYGLYLSERKKRKDMEQPDLEPPDRPGP